MKELLCIVVILAAISFLIHFGVKEMDRMGREDRIRNNLKRKP